MKKRELAAGVGGLQKGVTLIEVLVAVSLLSLLSLGMLMAIRVGLNALGKANDRLMENRRVAGVQRILASQIAGLIPVMAQCMSTGEGPRTPMPFFQGEAQSMRFVSAYSLAAAWRGVSQILEYRVIPGENGKGVRLVVNEIPYTDPLGAGLLCMGRSVDPVTGGLVGLFRPIEVGPNSFVLADKLAACRFRYLAPRAPNAPPDAPPLWESTWGFSSWPTGIRVEMAPLEDNPSRLRPITVTAPVHIQRVPEMQYEDLP